MAGKQSVIGERGTGLNYLHHLLPHLARWEPLRGYLFDRWYVIRRSVLNSIRIAFEYRRLLDILNSRACRK
jgi:hypothetical protein